MPPKRAKQDPAAKEAAFKDFCEGEDMKALNAWVELKTKEDEVVKLENAYLDITGDWQPILSGLYSLLT